jgi:hypothetical protein
MQIFNRVMCGFVSPERVQHNESRTLPRRILLEAMDKRRGLSRVVAFDEGLTEHSKPSGIPNQLETVSTIERNKTAELVLLNANPLDDIHNTAQIR